MTFRRWLMLRLDEKGAAGDLARLAVLTRGDTVVDIHRELGPLWPTTGWASDRYRREKVCPFRVMALQEFNYRGTDARIDARIAELRANAADWRCA